jgi:indolepyruvate ferredoxin oxidoreductase
MIRGYGHVKEEHYAKAKLRREQLLSAWRNPQTAKAAA